jgi:hypothetical protein
MKTHRGVSTSAARSMRTFATLSLLSAPVQSSGRTPSEMATSEKLCSKRHVGAHTKARVNRLPKSESIFMVSGGRRRVKTERWN